ncbi:MAG TPA: SurA N-terminal domain-containing protein, partial [Coxiellaceae bacterium]|nr:SurA N-terminal domain-containing protein [Coxiellaceae bacterium]
MKISRYLLSAIICLFTSAAFSSNLPTPAPTHETLNSVVAIVNNEVITQDAFDAALARAKIQFAANQEALDETRLKQMVMQQLINQTLQLQIAERAHITVSDKKVSQAIASIAIASHLTVAQLKTKLAKEKISYDDYRKVIHQQLLMHAVQQSAIGNQARPSQADIDKVTADYHAQFNQQKQFHVIDILLPTKTQAEKITLQLKQGGDVNKISPDELSDLGWQNGNQLPAVFLTQLQQMKTGDVVGPIQAPNGFHVLKLLGVRGQMKT